MGNRLELSICIPCYNGGDKVVECVKHILTYRGDDIEVVVSDNASQDNAIDKLREIKDERLKIFINDENIGPFRNWYAALSRGNGRYVMLLQDNDMLVVENLPKYLFFLRRVNFDIIKNAYNNCEQVSKAITGAQCQYFSKIFSHVSYQTYRGAVIKELKPLECSFDYEFCAYPPCIWDMQILQKYNINRKSVYINGNIEIVKLLNKGNNSRTREYVSKKTSSYTFENAMYMFDRSVKVLKKLYNNKKDFLKLYLYLYMGDLLVGTLWFYGCMNDSHVKRRYQVEAKEENIDYLRLNNIFLDHAKENLVMKEGLNKKIVCLKLDIITFRNRLLFKLNHVYERKFTNWYYFWGCVVNKILKVTLDVIL